VLTFVKCFPADSTDQIAARRIARIGSPPLEDAGEDELAKYESNLPMEFPSLFPDRRADPANTRKIMEDRELEEAIELSRRDFQVGEAISSSRDIGQVEIIPEYCPIRHRAAISRLIQIINGENPKLDSAPKVWTLLGVANYFGCTDVVVSIVLFLRAIR
jgi:hypothetical protein